MGSKVDQEVDDETNDGTDEQPDTTDMPGLESENLLNKEENKKDKD